MDDSWAGWLLLAAAGREEKWTQTLVAGCRARSLTSSAAVFINTYIRAFGRRLVCLFAPPAHKTSRRERDDAKRRLAERARIRQGERERLSVGVQ